jgi:flagellar biosynthesis/type III secretory pathway chaperone
MPETIIASAQRLADVLERENRALKSMDLPRAATLLHEKTAAIAALEASAKAAPASRDAALVPVARRLDRLALDNKYLLERAIMAQQRVIGIIARAAASVSTGSSYEAGGRRTRVAAMALSTRA